jgi:hypothetical protein
VTFVDQGRHDAMVANCSRATPNLLPADGAAIANADPTSSSQTQANYLQAKSE